MIARLLACLVMVAVAACEGIPGPSPSAIAPPATASGPAPTAPGAWRRIADIPTPRSEVAAAAFRNTIVVVGGFGGGRIAEQLLGGSAEQWRRLADYPLAVDHAMAAGIDAESPAGVYVMGGNVGAGATARAFRWLGDEGWTEIAPMPAPRSQGAAVAMGSRIYVVGGQADGRLVAPIYVYDLATRAWSTGAPIPTPRDHLAAVALDGRVCAVGGRRLSLDLNLAALECYEPLADRWYRLPDAPTPRGGVGAATVGRRLYFIGGERPTGTFKEVEVYDAATGVWSRGPDLPTPRHGIGVAAIGSIVYVLTGGPTPGGSQTAVCEALSVR